MDIAHKSEANVEVPHTVWSNSHGTPHATASRMRFDLLVRRVGGIDASDQFPFDGKRRWRAQAVLVLVVNRDTGLVASAKAFSTRFVPRPETGSEEALKVYRRDIYRNFLRARRNAIDYALAELTFRAEGGAMGITSDYDLRISCPLPARLTAGLARIQVMDRHFGTDLWGFMNEAERAIENARYGIADELVELLNETIEADLTVESGQPGGLELSWVTERLGKHVRSHNAKVAQAAASKSSDASGSPASLHEVAHH